MIKEKKIEFNTITPKQVMAERIVPTPMPKKYKEFFEVLPLNSQWIMGITGPSGAGKSTFLILFSGILCHSGNLLYANIEERAKGGTLKRKIHDTGLLSKYPQANKKVKFLQITQDDQKKKETEYNKMIEELDSGKYKYCVIDSVSKLLGRGFKVADLIDLRVKYPDVNFMFVMHYRKDDAGYIGATSLRHEFDCFVEIKDLKAYNKKNRFKTKRTRNCQTLDFIANKR